MFELNTVTNEITITQGDSGSLVVNATDQTFSADDRALFTVTNGKKRVVMQRIYEIENNAFTVRFAPSDTKDWTPDKNYKWEVRYFFGAVIATDEDTGEQTITDATDVYTPTKDAYPMTVLDALGDF